MTHHVLHMADGSVAIMQTVGDADPAACLAKWPAASQANIVSHQPIDPATIPADRSFRNAWSHDGVSFGIDMDKAKAIKRAQLALSLAPSTDYLTAAAAVADLTGDDAAKAAAVAGQAALQSVIDHPDIDAATTVADLNAITTDTLTASVAKAVVAAPVSISAKPA